VCRYPQRGLEGRGKLGPTHKSIINQLRSILARPGPLSERAPLITVAPQSPRFWSGRWACRIANS